MFKISPAWSNPYGLSPEINHEIREGTPKRGGFLRSDVSSLPRGETLEDPMQFTPEWSNPYKQAPEVDHELRYMARPAGLAPRGLTLGDVPGATPFTKFGQNMARKILAKLQKLPQLQRQVALKSVLERIDSSLWPTFQTYLRKGIPLEEALATALSQGFVTSLLFAPANPRPLSGYMDCGDCSSCGGCTSNRPFALSGLGMSRSAVPDALKKIGPDPVKNADPMWEWVPGGKNPPGTSPPEYPGYYRRSKAYADAHSGRSGPNIPAPAMTDAQKNDPNYSYIWDGRNGFWIKKPKTAEQKESARKKHEKELLGWFKDNWQQYLTEKHKAKVTTGTAYFEKDRLLLEQLKPVVTKAFQVIRDTVKNGPFGHGWTGTGMPPNVAGLVKGKFEKTLRRMEHGEAPIHEFKNAADGGKTWQIFVYPLNNQIYAKPKPSKEWYESVWDTLKSIPGLGDILGAFEDFGSWMTDVLKKAWEFIKDVAEAVADAACDLLNTPGVDQALEAGGMAMGAPPGAGSAAGVGGRAACGRREEAPPPPPPAEEESGVSVAAIAIPAVIGLGALAYFASKKKGPSGKGA